MATSKIDWKEASARMAVAVGQLKELCREEGYMTLLQGVTTKLDVVTTADMERFRRFNVDRDPVRALQKELEREEREARAATDG